MAGPGCDATGAAEALLRTGLSERGLAILSGVRTLEGILRKQEAGRVRLDRDWRDPGLYVLAIFGAPTPTTTWAWRLEGHHGSWNFTLAGERISLTPRFQGANPATVRGGPHDGLRLLGPEEDAARHVLAGLDAAGRARAVVSTRAPPMPQPSGNPDLTRERRRGVALGTLTAAQQARVWALVETWAAALHPTLAAAELARARATRPGALHFAWMGGLRAGAPCFFRVHGDTLHIEYGRSGNHVHSVWRDPAGDFRPPPAPKPSKTR